MPGPMLTVFGNPPKVQATLSNRAIHLAYVHRDDRKSYQHDFASGVTVQLLTDGSIRLYRPDGRKLFADGFDLAR
jgi:hypothetical protein